MRALEPKNLALSAVIIIAAVGLFFLSREDQPNPTSQATIKDKPDKSESQAVKVEAPTDPVVDLLGTNPSIEQLLAAIRDTTHSSKLRQSLVSRLAKHKDRKKVAAELVRLFAFLIDKAKDHDVRLQILREFQGFIGNERVRGKLLEFTQPKAHFDERRVAITSLTKNASSWVRPYLEPLALRDTDPRIRKHAEQALAKLPKQP